MNHIIDVSPSGPDEPMLRDAISYAKKWKYRIRPLPGTYNFINPLALCSAPFERILFYGDEGYASEIIFDFPFVKKAAAVTNNSSRESRIGEFTIIAGNRGPTRFVNPMSQDPTYNSADYCDASVVHQPMQDCIGFATDYQCDYGSSGDEYKNIKVQNAGTCFAVGVGGTALNSDYHTWDGCGGYMADIFMSWAHSQARTNVVKNASVGECRLLFTGSFHKRSNAENPQGVPPTIEGKNQFGWFHTLGDFSSRFGQGFIWSGISAESFKGLVHWMGRDGASAKIKDSRLAIDMSSGANPFLGSNNQLECISEAHSPFTFENCTIGINPPTRPLRMTEGGEIKDHFFSFRDMGNFSAMMIKG